MEPWVADSVALALDPTVGDECADRAKEGGSERL